MTEASFIAVYESADLSPVSMETIDRCVACHGTNIAVWARKPFSYTVSGSVFPFTIMRCANCGTGFLNPPPSPAFLARIYSYSGHSLRAPISLAQVLGTEEKFPNSTVDAARMVRVGLSLNRSGNRRALDVGSGFGFATREMRAAGLQTVSLNPGEYENRVFEELNGDAPLKMMFSDYRDTERFGLILLSQVLEHIVAPEKAVALISDLLDPGGVFVCAVPNFRSLSVALLGTRDDSCLWVPEHVNYFTMDGLTALVERYGFSVAASSFVTRVRPDAISRRLARLPGKRFIDATFKYFQIPAAAAANALGRGLYMNMYAIKQ